ncbi:hypothetical protein BB560_001353 [Smittium megazygosporum]|uniref:DUF4211 domain-containing protein n=1 Tax=Smittium megazygosporum TaxID=133381 RepID=A0A2T9ZHT4_9FUNG|nr:hypothetical protein BB560_001353 [Smittium megazygosporum]
MEFDEAQIETPENKKDSLATETLPEDPIPSIIEADSEKNIFGPLIKVSLSPSSSKSLPKNYKEFTANDSLTLQKNLKNEIIPVSLNLGSESSESTEIKNINDSDTKTEIPVAPIRISMYDSSNKMIKTTGEPLFKDPFIELPKSSLKPTQEELSELYKAYSDFKKGSIHQDISSVVNSGKKSIRFKGSAVSKKQNKAKTYARRKPKSEKVYQPALSSDSDSISEEETASESDTMTKFWFYKVQPKKDVSIIVTKNEQEATVFKKVREAIQNKLENLKLTTQLSRPESNSLQYSSQRRATKLAVLSDDDEEEEGESSTNKTTTLDQKTIDQNFFQNKYNNPSQKFTKSQSKLIAQSDSEMSSDDFLSLKNQQTPADSHDPLKTTLQDLKPLSDLDSISANLSKENISSSNDDPFLSIKPDSEAVSPNGNQNLDRPVKKTNDVMPQLNLLSKTDFGKDSADSITDTLITQFENSGFEIRGLSSKKRDLRIRDFNDQEESSSEELSSPPNITKKSLRSIKKSKKRPGFRELIRRRIGKSKSFFFLKKKKSQKTGGLGTYSSDSSFPGESDSSNISDSSEVLDFSDTESHFKSRHPKSQGSHKRRSKLPKYKSGRSARANSQKSYMDFFPQERDENMYISEDRNSQNSNNLSDFIVSDDDVIETSEVGYYNNKRFTHIPTVITQSPHSHKDGSSRKGNYCPSILENFGMNLTKDFRSQFNGYIQFLVHRILNTDILSSYDSETVEYFRRSEDGIEGKISSIKNSLVGSSAWNPQFFKDIQDFPVYYDLPTAPEPGCEACSFKKSRTSRFNVYLIGSSYIFSLYKEVKDFRVPKFNSSRDDLPYFRFMQGKLSPSILANFNVIPYDVKMGIDNGDIRYSTPDDVMRLDIYGACYKMGQTCHKRSKLYHYLHHYGYYLAMRLTEEVENLHGNVQMTDLGVVERINIAEDIVKSLDSSNVMRNLFNELTGSLDGAIEL